MKILVVTLILLAGCTTPEREVLPKPYRPPVSRSVGRILKGIAAERAEMQEELEIAEELRK